ncbi:MAG: tyrosine--tRNA ligase [Gammaproteobacteria bacterium]|nr:tyrosine--tRNA ligase [Gammaproteobacteria bacterium]
MPTDVLAELENRELLAQCTADQALREHFASATRTVYAGFDPTADSLHIGSLVPLLALRRAQLAGHRPLVLVGGATGLIGDPSFKAEERKLNSVDTVAQWVESLKRQTSRFVDFDASDNPAIIVNNLDWTADVTVLDFLRDVGKHFSINSMINKESVRQRIDREGEGISFTEFSYMVLQSFDFAQLYSEYDCTVQIGGSDQWGNITGGIDLVRRMHQGQAYGVTLPLVTKSDGSKFGKTETGTVWLDAAKTSPYAFYQFWMNTADADVYRFLRYFTFLPVQGIADIERDDAQAGGRRQAQPVLAREVTELVHGAAGYAGARRISEALFSSDVSALTESDFEQLAQDGLPCTKISESGKPLLELLVDTGLALTPRGEVTVGQARKFIQSNAVAVNGQKIDDIDTVLDRSSANFGRFHLLKRGKKHFHLLCWV